MDKSAFEPLDLKQIKALHSQFHGPAAQSELICRAAGWFVVLFPVVAFVLSLDGRVSIGAWILAILIGMFFGYRGDDFRQDCIVDDAEAALDDFRVLAFDQLGMAGSEWVNRMERLIAMQKGHLLLRQKRAFYKAVVLSKPQIEAGG